MTPTWPEASDLFGCWLNVEGCTVTQISDLFENSVFLKAKVQKCSPSIVLVLLGITVCLFLFVLFFLFLIISLRI